MKLKTVFALGLFITLIAAIATSNFLFAAMGKLERPSFAIRNGIVSKEDYEKIVAVLNRKDCKFVEGMWLNSFTTLKYKSETVPLNLFIKELTECPNVIVHVSFYQSEPQDADWTVSNSADNRFNICINLKSKAIDMEKLYLPEYTSKNVERKSPK